MPTLPTTSLSVGDTLHGFTVRAVTPVPELNLLAIELLHEKSGARMLHLASDDKENLFSINFPTPNRDDRGIPHILEHTVLSGSKRYPVRDPFFEMIRMSMATFINAMTGHACTYYPVCSNVEKDLFNLADVYFDAVFHPLLAENSFKREGHHRCPAKPDEPTGALSVNGIVYNEMKSYFSRPEEKLVRDLFKNLVPDTVFGAESGGDPEAIPSLSYEDFLAFHRTWYHPSNCRVITYGNIPVEKFLAFLEPRFDEYDRADVVPEYPRQTPWAEPRRVESSYAAEEGDDLSHKTFHVLAWHLPLDLDAELDTLFGLLATVLVGDDAAPLRRALVDSGLGEDVVAADPLDIGRDSVFCIGIRGSDPDKFEEFREQVLKTLRRLVREGVPTDLIESAFRAELYDTRDIARFRGLNLAEGVLESWIFGGDPLLFLRSAGIVAACEKKWKAHRSLFAELIDKYLLGNPHRLDYSLAPSAAYQAAVDAAFAEKMAAERARLTDDEMRAFAAEDARLQEEAGRPNPPEALATLPQLALSDLPAEPDFTDTSLETLPCGVRMVRPDLFTNGVNRVAVFADLTGLDTDLWKYLLFYIEVFNSMGAAGHDFAETARLTSAYTGGISCAPTILRSSFIPGVRALGLKFSMRAIDETMGAALDLFGDRIQAPNPRDAKRLRDVVTQTYSRFRSAMVNTGNAPAMNEIAAGLSEEGYLESLLTGLPAFRLVQSMHAHFESRFKQIISAVLRINQFLRNRSRYTLAFVGSDEAAEKVRHTFESIFSAFPEEPVEEKPIGFQPAEGVRRVGLTCPSTVAHCAQIVQGLPAGDPDDILVFLGASMLSVEYAINELRFKGNAYGASTRYNIPNGNFVLSTYADPHVKRTFDVFRALPAYVRDVPWTQTEVTRGILTCAKGFIRPVTPASAIGDALNDVLLKKTREAVTARYNALVSATPDALKAALLRVLTDEAFAAAPMGVVSSREKLEKENAEMGELALELTPLVD